MAGKVSYESYREMVFQQSQIKQVNQLFPYRSRNRAECVQSYKKLCSLLYNELDMGTNPFLLEYFLARYHVYGTLDLWQYMMIAAICDEKKFPDHVITKYYLLDAACNTEENQYAVQAISALQDANVMNEAEQQETQETRKLQSLTAQLRQEVSELEKHKQNLEQEIQRQRQEGSSANQKWLEEERRKMKDELQERRSESLRQLEEEKERQMKLLQEDPEKNLAAEERRQERERYDAQVEEMIATRRRRIDEVVAEMQNVSGTFRECTDQSLESLEQTLNEAFDQFRTNMEQKTAESIIRVVESERRLKAGDFSDLLDGYSSLEQQVYYRRMECGEESDEYRLYWKKVDRFLRRFLRTLSKLGFRRLDVKEGDPFDESRMEMFDDEDRQPPEIENPLDYFVDQVIADGFSDDVSDVELENIRVKAIVSVRKRGITDVDRI